jgi:hypothetical protein
MSKERPIDKAKAYREQFRKEMNELSAAERAAHPPALAGLTHHRLERFIYLALLVGETPRQQRKAVFEHCKHLHALHGEGRCACVGDQEWRLTLPSGETFCDFRVVRFPVFTWQTEDQMLPIVEFAASNLRAFAASTGRASGTIEHDPRGQPLFTCSDGRRIPLASCTYRQLTDADFAPTRRRAPKKA